MTPEQEKKERGKFEEYWENRFPYHKYRADFSIREYVEFGFLERARLDTRNIGSHDLGDIYKE